MLTAKVKMIIGGIALLAVFVAGMTAGAWKEGAAFRLVENELQASNLDLQKEITRLNKVESDLKAAIATQNAAVALLEAGTNTAKKVQQEAQKRADGLELISKKRLDRIEAMMPSAKSCSDVLFQYWSERQ